jgi:hypothetical protein
VCGASWGEKRKREARIMGRGEGYKKGGIIGDIMIYGW